MLWDKPYSKIYNEKIKRYNFAAILEEPTYGEEVVKSELSQGAYKLITEWQRDIYFNKEFLKDYFELRKLPISEKVIDFFCVYGGRAFCYEDHLLFMDTIQINQGYIIQSFPMHADEKDGNFYYDCMDYHYAGDWGPHIDQNGRIHSFSMGEYYKEADNMAEFMEQQWHKAVNNRENLKHIINGTEERKNYLHNRSIKRKDNILQNVYEYLIPYCIPEMIKMIEPLIFLILEKNISLNDEQVNQLMEGILTNQNISEELIMDILEFLSFKHNSLKTILNMVDVVSKVTLQKRKEQFLIDKLIQWEDDYPEVKKIF
ncbi:hypothetical protein ACUH7Y_16160 [Clostridium beijerinckii]|uniref:SMI1/KNR4 family protein n=1 Tax=Clostridium beijerinckii TaxID=1520 RepID=A0A7X9XRK7_CLOBE|nr:hypothetical protein [Clostridium beijerinckii]NMF07156.1 hypothetical protein [Clostridium beijerinckii]